ncbi:hypothetical protein P872_18440 [Rhodonellum psychrophilum GCM71 = DSM 17998]|uniref:Uncharacterized protein n=2 Tax=Rhodonellum TaxID=336827 RepID=U5C2J3_9BACT|nr:MULTISPECIES: hypothetical protein [Rhodonellum]ERM82377.1 hypothetical protein P872_18440 [Rhodonellum psychrophilum GCM71 = DSM 17998]SDZ35439.1 hypothetical protein SAMN05444412_11143 [Rhodonellum ikkaensis]
MKGFILFIIAIILFIPLTIWNIIEVGIKYKSWKSIDGYFFNTAYDIDRFGNHNFRTLLNKYLIKSNGYQFGDFRETISSVLGKNLRDNTLTKAGIYLVKILDYIDENHCEKSIIELT